MRFIPAMYILLFNIRVRNKSLFSLLILSNYYFKDKSYKIISYCHIFNCY